MLDLQSVSQKKAFCCHCRIVGDVSALVPALFPATAHSVGRANSPSILEGVPSGGVVILNIRIPCEKMPLTTICESKITVSITS